MLLWCGAVAAQDDPTVMTVGGQPVSRSEFEYSYNKNNSDGVIDKKTVPEYVELFANYKRKVRAALDARLDTLSSFQQEFRTYRDQQIYPLMTTDADVEQEAHNYYNRLVEQIGPRGLYQASHILLLSNEKDPQGRKDSVKTRIDSIYTAIQKGADFGELAEKCSQDPGSARQGGLLPLVGPGQMVKPFEDQAYAMKEGEVSKPFQTQFGWHIIKMVKRQPVPPYDSLGTNIKQFLESRNVRLGLANQKVDSLSKATGRSHAEVMDSISAIYQAKDPELNNLVREYHDGLLLYEISNRNVWDKAQKDTKGLENYFKKHRKQYAFDGPRFKGIAYHTQKQADIEAVKDAIRNLPFDKWADKLRTTFNNDSVIRIRVEKGIFKPGDNALVDKVEFGKDTTVTALKGYPYDATFGRKLAKPESYEDVQGQVVADYQDELEKKWVAELKKKYDCVVDEKVLATVNKH